MCIRDSHELVYTNQANINNKQDALTFSSVEDNHVSNPVTSANIKDYVDNKFVGEVTIQATGQDTAGLKILSHADAADDKVVLTLERDSSNPSVYGHDHALDFSMSQHGSCRFIHRLFPNLPSSTLTYELMRWTKFGCIMIGGQVSSSIYDSNQSQSVSKPGLNVLQGTIKHTGLGSDGCRMILNNLPTSEPTENNRVWRDSNGFLKIS